MKTIWNDDGTNGPALICAPPAGHKFNAGTKDTDMTTRHTPEPWSVDSFRGIGQWQICSIAGTATPGLIADGVRIGNAARIVACVNACAGLIDPATSLRDNFSFGTDMANTVEHLRAERGELRAALEHIAALGYIANERPAKAIEAALKLAGAALAKARS